MSGDAEAGVLTALIADDEALARRRLAELLRGRDGIRVVGQCATGRATLEAVRALRPDVLFLDVQMPGLDGFEVLGRLEAGERPLVIFSTAYDEYALAAFEVHAVDYLLKPFSDERFEASLERTMQAHWSERLADVHDHLRRLLDQVAGSGTPYGPGPAPVATAPPPQGAFLDRLAVRSGERLTPVDVASIDWIEAAGDYVRVHAGAGIHVVRGTMAALERRLDPGRFLRIHRSTIARVDRIRSLQTDADGRYTAVVEGGVRLRVGRRYRDAVLARLGARW